MKKIPPILLSLAVLLCLSGCAAPAGHISAAVWHAVVSAPDQPLREFHAEPQLYQGVFVGIVKRSGITDPWDKSQVTQEMEYYDLRFSGPLKGDERTLQILTPVRLFKNTAWNPNGVAMEIPEPMPDGRPAFLYLGALPQGKKTSDLKFIYSDLYDVPVEAWEKYPVLLETRVDIQIPVPGNGRSIALAYPFNLNDRFYVLSPVTLDVKRVIRSRTSAFVRPVLGCTSMLITIPLDIITSPIQFIIWMRGFG